MQNKNLSLSTDTVISEIELLFACLDSVVVLAWVQSAGTDADQHRRNDAWRDRVRR